MQKIDPSVCKGPFPDSEVLFQTICRYSNLMTELQTRAREYQTEIFNLSPLLRDGSMTSLNYGVQPFIVTVYGPTGSGKSQFIRNVISSRLIEPTPETVFFITPQKGTVPLEEQLSWKAQAVEGNYRGEKPTSKRLTPRFVQLSFEEAIADHNLNLDSPLNCFAAAAEKGPVCIVIDECMNQLGTCRAISSFFHALPSKIFGRYPQCSGYTVLVVLHNMNPRSDRGNIKDLKIQAKCHIISPQLEASQVLRFIRQYSFGFPSALVVVLKDIVDHARIASRYSWLIYNNVPINDSLRWAYYSPDEQLKPICMNLQAIFYKMCAEIRRTYLKRTYSQMQYLRKIQ